MWGYRTQRFNNFGWFSAKVDDVLNFIPARLTAISYTLLGDSKTAWQCWRGQAKHCASPNGGPVMCAGAGSLGIELGGPTTYHGECIDKPIMGQGRAVVIGDITRAIQLMNNSVYLWLTIICLWGLLIA